MSATGGNGSQPGREDYSPFIAPAGAKAAANAGDLSLLERLEALQLRPSEGWLTLGLVIVMVATIGLSLDDPQWVLGNGELTDFLAPVGALGVVWGFLSAKAGWSRWLAHFLGAVFAALIVPIAVGIGLNPADQSIGGLFHATAESTVNAYLDLAWRGQTITQQYGHFMLVLGILCWATGQFAGYAVFGHRRPLNAVVLTGMLLVAGMSITIRDQLGFLVLFSLAALSLLVRSHTLEERTSWLRRRIGDPATVGRLYLRGGSAFVAAAVGAALLLTATASSAPLAGAWTGVDQQIIEWGQQIQRFLPCCGAGTRISGVSFGPNADIVGVWETSSTPAVVITRNPTDTTPYYWMATTYDTFTLKGWTRSKEVGVDRQPGESMLKDTLEGQYPPREKQTASFNISALRYRGDVLLTPTVPLTPMANFVDSVPTHLTLLADGSYFLSVQSDDHDDYQVTADVPTVGDKGINQNLLRAAGKSYPPEIRGLYLDYPKEAIGPNATKLLKEIKTSGKTDTPFDLAMTTQSYLRSNAFTYDQDVRAFGCTSNVVECFARDRHGYCQYFASTMAILLRAEGVPTRLVQGFLPGDKDSSGAHETLTFAQSHAWVQVYFPGIGWVNFDPTGGRAVVTALPAGPAIPALPSPSVAEIPSVGDFQSDDPRRSVRPAGGGTESGGPSSPGSLPFVMVGLLLLTAVLGLAFAAYQRGPRGPIQPDSVYDGVVRLARRFGYGPRPTQTVYEYTGALGDELPAARPSLELVARAKVEVAYGRRELGQDRLGALREAQRRLRVTLLRLIFRRHRWRGRR